MLIGETIFWEQMASHLGNFLALVVLAVIGTLLMWLRARLLPFVNDIDRRLRTGRQGDLDRGKIEAVEREAATWQGLNPLIITSKARRVFGPILPALKAIGAEYRSRQDLYDSDWLSYRIEEKFREFFLEVACPALKLRHRGCVVVAMELALETDANGSVGEVG